MEPYFISAEQNNPWFTRESIINSIVALANNLTQEKIEQWLSAYSIKNEPPLKQVGVVMAGNIPLVGFHDMLSVLITGNRLLAKLSAKDQHLYRMIKEMLITIEPAYDQLITFTDQPLKDVDAIIATGSDNTSRYFEYYFNSYPHIIRRNRNSIAILDGSETSEELKNLANDVLMYFGLGCRNVSMLLLPEHYPFNELSSAFSNFEHIKNISKYANNYDYQKAILAMNRVPYFDNGLLLLKEDQALASPISTLNYSFYKQKSEVEDFIQVNKHKIQCVVSKTKWPFSTYGFGKAQEPELSDYADGIDTIAFLNGLN